MSLIFSANGQRVYSRNASGEAYDGIYNVRDWQLIQERSEISDLIQFSVTDPCFDDGTRFIPGRRDELLFYETEDAYDNDVRFFGGILTESKESVTVKGNRFFATYDFTVQSFDIILDKELRQSRLLGYTWGDLLEYLVTTHFFSQLTQDFSHIDNPIDAPPVRLVNGTLRNLLKAMRSITGYDYGVDAYKKLHVFDASNRPFGAELDDTPVSGLCIYESRPLVSIDSRNMYNIIRQPYNQRVNIEDWPGEQFTGKGDPKGQGGILPLLRTPVPTSDNNFLEEKFDGNAIDTNKWVQVDSNSTISPDYPNQGYIIQTNGQLQVIGGSGTVGDTLLYSVNLKPFVEQSYIVMEFQLTDDEGEGYIGLFLDGLGVTSDHYKAGLHIVDGALKALDGTTLVASLGTVANYLIWVTQTMDGWQYAIQGGAYAERQTIHEETGVTHADDYLVSPVSSKDLMCSINSFRYRTSDYDVMLDINGVKKVVGLESTDTDLPDIDAFLNIDETPALLKFRAASSIATVASVASATVFTLASGQGQKVRAGMRLLLGLDLIGDFEGREAYVTEVDGDEITIKSPGLSGVSNGNIVLVGTTVPAKDDNILVRYAYSKLDEAVVSDTANVQTYGPYPLTLAQKDYITTAFEAQAEAEGYLRRYKDGITKVQFSTNTRLLAGLTIDLDTKTALPVNLTNRPEPIDTDLTIQKIVTIPVLPGIYKHTIEAESGDPVKPFDDAIKNNELVIGLAATEDAIRLSASVLTVEVPECEDIVLHEVASPYIKFVNPEGRKFGEFKFKP